VKAQNLKEAYNIFDPTPLEANIDPFYIRRGESLVKLFSTFDQEPIKVLFSGHRGSGKTTELNYTEKSLASKYTVFNLKIGRYLDSNEFDLSNILEAILSSFIRQPSFMREILKEVSSSTAIFRSIITKSNNLRQKDYLAGLNELISKVQKKTGKKVLLLIDDLDKFPTGIKKVLLEEGQAFPGIDCSMVMTVPITLFYSSKIKNITEWFPHAEILPNIHPREKNGDIYQPGVDILKELVLRRIEPGLITNKAIERAVFYSGGVFRYLVKLVQDSSFSALTAGENSITVEHIDGSITRMRSDFGRIIGMDDYEALGKIHKQKNLVNIANDVRFIANDIVLEYQNKTRWVDIHPVVLGLLPTV